MSIIHIPDSVTLQQVTTSGNPELAKSIFSQTLCNQGDSNKKLQGDIDSGSQESGPGVIREEITTILQTCNRVLGRPRERKGGCRSLKMGRKTNTGVTQ